MMGPKFYLGCVAIGFTLGLFIPFPASIILSIPAGFAWAQYYLGRWPGE